MITKNKNTFHLRGKNISYVMVVNATDDLLHYYFGKKIGDADYSVRIKNKVYGEVNNDENGVFLETQCHEYPSYGHTDLRTPSYSVKNKYGNCVSRLKFKDYQIKENSVAEINGMPSFYKGDFNAQTLQITLYDEISEFEVVLSYTVFDEYDVILRSAKIKNVSDEEMTLESAYSMNIDFSKRDMDLIYFPGAWVREREFMRVNVKLGEKIDISNARGGSGHAVNPAVILCDRNATENSGDVYGFALVYSGNHSNFIECDQYGKIRMMQGINPFGFEKVLKSGEEFYTPQSVACYSSEGIGGMSREMHDIIRNNLCKSKWAKEDRPILINNWEGTYFDFNEEKLLNIVKKAKEVGIELFVLDDGWFGKRNNDTCSLGDWVVNTEKLPSGIDGLAEKVNKEGLKFGLWFEPEMVNPDSDLYRKHPDWAIATPNRTPALGRYQYQLDLTNDEVCEYVINAVGDVLSTANISYVKWDYNRMMSDMPRKGYNHEYILGFYKVMEALSERFPDVLIEGCASGGGRFDLGILAYSPQIWTSDNSDAISRLRIQYSTSIFYPVCTMSAHVTASPNHQVGRVTPLKTRADIAYAGIFGYEIDITKMTDDEIEEVKGQIEFYKSIRTLVRTGDFYRINSPYDENYCTWQIVSKDKSETVLLSSRILAYANFDDKEIKLSGLLEEVVYEDDETGLEYFGSELMNKGIALEYGNDFSTVFKYFKTKCVKMA